MIVLNLQMHFNSAVLHLIHPLNIFLFVRADFKVTKRMFWETEMITQSTVISNK